ncbi:MAG TPA: hypothetical protein VFE62_00010 [Gemmataceae bacterium]|nr:hypothetical protein [Gemmataceae bacterium]
MGTGIFAVCLCLALGQNTGDVRYAGFRDLRVPVKVTAAERPDVRELLLYASTDQGRKWKQVAGPITPDKEHFVFYAPADGLYWLRVAKINRQGVQNPDDNSLMSGPPDMKLMIDTLKPIVRSIQATRYNDDVHVTWDVQEDNPNLSTEGMRLEYQIKDSSDSWKPIQMPPGLTGKTQFTPGHNHPLVVRLTITDLARNQSYAMAEVQGTLTPAGYSNPDRSPTLPGQLTMPDRKVQPLEIENKVPPPVDIDKTRPPVAPLPTNDGILGNGKIAPPSGGLLSGPPKTIAPPPVGPLPPPMGIAPVEGPKPGALVGQEKDSGDKVIADSRFQPEKPVQREIQPSMPGGIVPPMGEKSIVNSAPARKPLPAIQYVNQHQIMLEYELRRVGPSGIGGIELWLTRDDGDTWEPYAADEDVQATALNNRQKRKFDLRDASDRPLADGVYGLTLVVKNRAGLGKKPRPGDVPEIRVEIDTTLPFAQMFQPIADPQHPDQVLLKWTAEDKNLAQTPITLEYAEKADGQWQVIANDLDNSGRFSWKVGPGIPVQVFLRMRVRDKAGNERVLVTPQAQFIDFTEPEGALIGVQTQGKAP